MPKTKRKLDGRRKVRIEVRPTQTVVVTLVTPVEKGPDGNVDEDGRPISVVTTRVFHGMVRTRVPMSPEAATELRDCLNKLLGPAEAEKRKKIKKK